MRRLSHALPEPLHWFKWEAYWTWLSGFALLTVLYYVQPHTYLIDPSVAKLSSAEAIGASYRNYVNPQWVRLLDVLQMNVR